MSRRVRRAGLPARATTSTSGTSAPTFTLELADLEITAEIVHGRAKGKTSTTAVAPCDERRLPPLHRRLRRRSRIALTNTFMPYARVDWRDAVHQSRRELRLHLGPRARDASACAPRSGRASSSRSRRPRTASSAGSASSPTTSSTTLARASSTRCAPMRAPVRHPRSRLVLFVGRRRQQAADRQRQRHGARSKEPRRTARASSSTSRTCPARRRCRRSTR